MIHARHVVRDNFEKYNTLRTLCIAFVKWVWFTWCAQGVSAVHRILCAIHWTETETLIQDNIDNKISFLFLFWSVYQNKRIHSLKWRTCTHTQYVSLAVLNIGISRTKNHKGRYRRNRHQPKKKKTADWMDGVTVGVGAGGIFLQRFLCHFRNMVIKHGRFVCTPNVRSSNLHDFRTRSWKNFDIFSQSTILWFYVNATHTHSNVIHRSKKHTPNILGVCWLYYRVWRDNQAFFRCLEKPTADANEAMGSETNLNRFSLPSLHLPFIIYPFFVCSIAVFGIIFILLLEPDVWVSFLLKLNFNPWINSEEVVRKISSNRYHADFWYAISIAVPNLHK